jgi:hypothetical protein
VAWLSLGDKMRSQIFRHQRSAESKIWTWFHSCGNFIGCLGPNCVIFTQSIDPLLLPLTVFHFTRIGRVAVYQPHCLHHLHSGKFRSNEVANFARNEKHFDVCTQVSGCSLSRVRNMFPSSHQDIRIDRNLIILPNIPWL